MDDELCLRIVGEIAKREDVDPTELTPPLYEVIDPTALEQLFRSESSSAERSGGTVRFTYCGYRIVVDSDYSVTISELEQVSNAHTDASTGQKVE